jgi:hypothetical protein
MLYRYRTPLCVLFSARIIAAGCYILAQYLVDGPHSLSLDARLSETPPSASLPTPPTHKAASPDASRLAIDYWRLSNDDLKEVSEAVTILLEYYSSHDLSRQEHLQAVATVSLILSVHVFQAFHPNPCHYSCNRRVSLPHAREYILYPFPSLHRQTQKHLRGRPSSILGHQAQCTVIPRP